MSVTLERIEVVRELYSAFATHDADRVMSLVDDSLIVIQTESLPWGGEYHGKDGLRQFFQRLLGTIESQVETQELFEAGEQVVVIGRVRGTVHANEAPFDVRIVHIWTVREGKAARFEAYIDTPEMLAALGGGVGG
jgi:ketosteroid isomerase-like protein